MHTEREITVLETHTAGEPTRIITDEIEPIVNDGDIREKRADFAENHDEIRQLLMQEPRGHADMYGAAIVDSSHPDADFGTFFMDGGGYVDMCGHATIGIVTAFIETGRLEPQEVFKIETPCGIVRARPTLENDRVSQVAVENVDSFYVEEREVPVEIGAERELIPVDLVYSGNLFALVDASDIGLPIIPERADNFQQYGGAIRRKLNEQPSIEHPVEGTVHDVSVVEFYEHGDPDRNIVIYGNRDQIDRSPCGSGTCAKMTYLYENGDLDLDESYPYQSVIGTEFEGTLLETETSNGVEMVTPQVTGSAYIVAEHTFYKDPHDPLIGFTI
ncbi:proline racemase family protein [Haloterrigena salinisoli]|uniref:proline racemase family protein n=1 Tax=Haloterrigena salinisoli TaxID=3132747 RepID=UPI0030CAF05F